LKDPGALKERLRRERGISGEELAGMVREKQKEFAGLLNESAAVYAIAKEHGLEIATEAPVQFGRIIALDERSKGVNLLCRVRRVYALKAFERNGRAGSVLNLQVEDESGAMKLVLWNSEAERAGRGGIEKGDVVEIRNAYVKQALGGGIELHLGLAGSMRRSEKSLEKVSAGKGPVKIGKLAEGMQEADVLARILELGSKTEFEREGKKSQVGSAVIGDETSTIRLVLWDSNANAIDRLKVNDVVKVEGGYVKKGRDGASELHLGWMGRLIANPRNAEVAQRKEILDVPLLRISELKPGEAAELKAVLKEILEAHDLKTCGDCGGEVGEKLCLSCKSANVKRRSMLRARLSDASGEVEASAYGRNAMKFIGVKKLADDIEFATAAHLKKEELLGKEFYLMGRLGEKKGGKSEFLVESVIS